ncbi:sensor histidine kinase [Streptomyces echinoruber]|uniref:histidine kinase n=1 Tax=Streptomyces echinoruber TaxID=68898 RepID=A0A918QXU6_9ACTN|nr:sensor histidine kinase [Streptomyces echinoruber]GGZ73442.1 hypothetical protein GCM10010389_08810 [Streptomyces echinoruber]
MSDPVSPARPGAHRRGGARRSPVERLVYDQIRSAVAASLVAAVAVLGAVVAVCRLLQLSTGHLVLAFAGGMLIAALVGARRADAAAGAVCRARAAEWQRIMEAAEALEKAAAWTAEELCRGGRPALPDAPARAVGGDLAAQAEAALIRAHAEAVRALFHVHERSQSAVLRSLLRHLTRRQHALVSRALEGLDRLEGRTEDPELLHGLFQLDHLMTRIRRLLESLGVLGGESLRSTRTPVSVVTVLRGAVSETVQYARVRVAAGVAGIRLALPGYVGPNLAHLLAELIENATEFSHPNTQVQVRAQEVPAGLAIEVEDRAVPLPDDLRARLNRLLAAPQEVDLSTQLREGQIGLLTAAMIARQHGMRVELHQNAAGSTTAVVIVPARLLVELEPPELIPAATPAADEPPRPAPAAPPAPAARPAPAASQAEDPASGPQAAPAGPPPLPRRQPEQLPPPSARPAAPARPATAGLAAAFRRGQQAAQPPAPGGGPHQHP